MQPPEATSLPMVEETTIREDVWAIIVPNSSTVKNFTSPATEDPEASVRELYVRLGSVLLVACAVALLVNAHVLAAVCWIRRPLSRTLRLSVSLAAADALSSLCFGLGLLFNSLLDRGLLVRVDACVALALEALRLGAMVSAELHLLALAVHHLLGILRPLQYPGAGLRRAGGLAIAALWLLPPAFFAAYFASLPDEGFRAADCPITFMYHFEYRAMVCSIVSAPLVAMFFIYVRIFALVRRHEACRPRHHSVGPAFTHYGSASGSGGGDANGGGGGAGGALNALTCKSSVRSNGRTPPKIVTEGGAVCRQQRVARHVKAARTTLLIVGSCVMGWAPAVSVYVLLCTDCPLGKPPATHFMFYVYSTCNLLLILKTLLNPIIYAARMNEIKLAGRRMRASLCCWCCAGRRGAEWRPGGSLGGVGGVGGGRSSAGAGGLARSLTLVGRLRSRSPARDSGISYCSASSAGAGNGVAETDRLRRASTRSHRRSARFAARTNDL